MHSDASSPAASDLEIPVRAQAMRAHPQQGPWSSWATLCADLRGGGHWHAYGWGTARVHSHRNRLGALAIRPAASLALSAPASSLTYVASTSII